MYEKKLNLSVNKMNLIADISTIRWFQNQVYCHQKQNLCNCRIALFYGVSTYLILLVKESFPFTVMIGAMKEGVGCYFNILTTST